uniref:Uncharacterized protein n=1 Tax=Myotis myotis TaxID=51298 RepID=A0A7J7RMK5_MYOMY|nr:hypothetical protein mMyoMyo1_010257 [Myotis myotis]
MKSLPGIRKPPETGWSQQASARRASVTNVAKAHHSPGWALRELGLTSSVVLFSWLSPGASAGRMDVVLCGSTCKLIWSLGRGPPAFEEASHRWEGTEPVHRGAQLTLPALGKCVHRMALSAHAWALMGLTEVPMTRQRRAPPGRRLCCLKAPPTPPEAPAQHRGKHSGGFGPMRVRR